MGPLRSSNVILDSSFSNEADAAHEETLVVQLIYFLHALQVTYSTLINGLGEQQINLNRKVLSELAINEPLSFKALVEQVKFMQAKPGSSGRRPQKLLAPNPS